MENVISNINNYLENNSLEMMSVKELIDINNILEKEEAETNNKEAKERYREMRMEIHNAFMNRRRMLKHALYRKAKAEKDIVHAKGLIEFLNKEIEKLEAEKEGEEIMLLDYQDDIKQLDLENKINVIEPDNIHLTIAFIAEEIKEKEEEIEEKKRQLQDLKKEKEFYCTKVAHSADTPLYKIVKVNKETKKLIVLNKREIVDETLFDTIKVLNESRVKKAIEQNLIPKEIAYIEKQPFYIKVVPKK